MKKSLELLKARSRRAVLNNEAVKIVEKAQSPTDAFKMAKRGSMHVSIDEAAEEVRYLAIIKRDYGEKAFSNFVAERKNEYLAKEFIDRVSVAVNYLDMLQVTLELGGEESLPNRKLAGVMSTFILSIMTDFENYYLAHLTSNTRTQKQCLELYEKYRSEVNHFCEMAHQERLLNVLYLGKYVFEKSTSVLLNIGFAVSELSGVHFLQKAPRYYLEYNIRE